MNKKTVAKKMNTGGHYSMKPSYQRMVRSLEKKGYTTSDAQGMADLKHDPHFKKK